MLRLPSLQYGLSKMLLKATPLPTLELCLVIRASEGSNDDSLEVLHTQTGGNNLPLSYRSRDTFVKR